MKQPITYDMVMGTRAQILNATIMKTLFSKNHHVTDNRRSLNKLTRKLCQGQYRVMPYLVGSYASPDPRNNNTKNLVTSHCNDVTISADSKFNFYT
jgi:hypothetical protein